MLLLNVILRSPRPLEPYLDYSQRSCFGTFIFDLKVLLKMDCIASGRLLNRCFAVLSSNFIFKSVVEPRLRL
jgi:hypothetical protein